jgi:type III pantothenate kinase
MRFTVDLGNSRWKIRGWQQAGDPPSARADFAGELGQRLRDLEAFLARAAPARGDFALSSVVAPEEERAVRACLARHGEVLPVEPGLENRCRAPERVGRDRLFAARAALELARRSCIVVDAGTALTVDAVLGLRTAPGAFLGGAIAPGPALLARCLVQGAARLSAVEPAPGAAFLGQDSAQAILSGVVNGFRGAARELVRGVAAEAGLEGAPIVLSGGAVRFLLEPTGVFPCAPLVHDDLVHLGLLRALDDSASRSRREP